MIEVACPTCGTLNQAEDAAAGTPLACTSCRQRYLVPATQAPKRTAMGLGIAGAGDAVDADDLPAPVPRRGPRAQELSLDDLLAPAPVVAAAEPPLQAEGDLPAPKRATAVASLDLDDLLGPNPVGAPDTAFSLEPAKRAADATDLPAPKRAAPGAAAIDLPAPKLRQPGGAAPPPVPARHPALEPPRPAANSIDLPTDLPAPRGPGVPDLPAPRARAGVVDLPAPRAPAGIVDLPAPRAHGVPDLPAPRAHGVPDLPAPRARPGDALAPRAPAGVVDLPAPRAPAGIIDLPAPRGAGAPPVPSAPSPPGVTDLLTPKLTPTGMDSPIPRHAAGVPPPLPRPAGASGADLPMPRPGGFSELPIPRPGGFSELPSPRGDVPDLPVPKGFFEDLPQPAGAGSTTDLAPKGFFEDLPRPTDEPSNAIAPKGFFEDAPGRPSRPNLRAHTPSAPGSLFDDIPVPSAGLDDLGLRSPHATQPPLDLSGHSSIDLGLPAPTRPSSSSIPPPMSTSNSGPVRVAPASSEVSHADLAVIADLGPPRVDPRAAPKAPTAAPVRSPRRTRLILAVVLGVVALGGAGAFGYQRYAAAQARSAEIAEALQQGKRALVAADAGHWQRAVAAAKRALALDEANPQAIGLGAEANFAAAIDDGVAAVARIRTGKQLLTKAAAEAINAPAIARARALAALANRNAEHAATQLRALMPNPDAADANLRLYLAWALAASAAPETLAAYDAALAAPAPQRLSALYGRGQARAALGDLEGARADFVAVLALDENHLGAQVELAAALPSAQGRQRESDLLAVLQRKDLANQDPRAVGRAWMLAGDEARRGGRLEVASERYRKALEIVPDQLAISIAVAQLELAKGRVETARATIEKVLALAADDPAAMLVAAEVDLASRQPSTAEERLEAVRNAGSKDPAIGARLALLSGRVREHTQNFDAALQLYGEAIALAGEGDLAPTMAAVGLRTTLADRVQVSDPDAAAAHRAEVERLLEPLTKRAAEDSSVAVTLGAAYLAGGNAVKAEEWLSRAVAQRPDDLDAKYQLAKAINKLGRVQEAIDLLDAAYKSSPERTDVGAELATALEDAGRVKDASALYEKLLAGADVPVGLRAHAGRFLARNGQIERAAAEGDAILAQVPEGDAAGYYLRGLGHLHAGRNEEARRDLQRATNLDHDPDYLDALGHAAEELGLGTGDTQLFDEALRAYTQSATLKPTVSPLHGIGRIRLARGEAKKALESLLLANQLAPDDGDVLYLVGVAYQSLRQFKVAATWLERANAKKPRAEAEYRLGMSLMELEQASGSAAALTRASQAALAEEANGGPKVEWLTEALYVLGRIEHDRRNEAAARRAWEAYLLRNPPNQTQVDEIKRLLRGMR
ncbi:MAG: tetratricopeptide repeat protein [Kofleriaceae bacterium]